ncbi:MAG: ABC transporter permease [Fimbriimonadaceae bacterium]|nr:ABC transporter permease [Fimbriimonadaceae bacterium]
MKKEFKPNEFVQEWGVLIAFVLFSVFVFVKFPDVFHNPLTWRNLFSQNVDVGLIALGMTMVIIGGGIDLSVGSMLALTGVLGLSFLNRQMGSGSESSAVLLSALGMVGIGGVLGAINGVIITKFRVVPFVATLVGLLVFRSLALAYANGGTITSSSKNEWAKVALTGVTLPVGKAGMLIPWSVFVLIAVALILGFLLNWTPFGRHLVAVGSNERAAKYSAISVDRVRLWTYTILGLCVGLAAWVASARLNSVTSTTLGQLYELDAIAAVVIGGTALSGGKGRIWGTFIGVLLLGMITTTLVAAGVSGYWQGVVKGGIILVAVLISRGKREN